MVPVLPPHAQRAYREHGIADGAIRRPGLGRYRVNLHRERNRAAAVIRLLPPKVPTLASLDLPAGTEKLSRPPRGLVIVGGATGSGKTTTVAALVDEINRRDAKHIVTIEDPIEYEHANHQSIVQQVEIGVDAPDFPTALRSALRQAPDVIVIGEMRDPETMRIALSAGETGHLVLSTLHTTDVPSTIARLTESFPAVRQATMRQEIAAALAAVYVQTLLPRQAGGRVPAAELLMVGYGARQHIRRNLLASTCIREIYDHPPAGVVLTRGAPGEARAARGRARIKIRSCAPRESPPTTSSTRWRREIGYRVKGVKRYRVDFHPISFHPISCFNVPRSTPTPLGSATSARDGGR